MIFLFQCGEKYSGIIYIILNKQFIEMYDMLSGFIHGG